MAVNYIRIRTSLEQVFFVDDHLPAQRSRPAPTKSPRPTSVIPDLSGISILKEMLVLLPTANLLYLPHLYFLPTFPFPAMPFHTRVIVLIVIFTIS